MILTPACRRSTSTVTSKPLLATSTTQSTPTRFASRCTTTSRFMRMGRGLIGFGALSMAAFGLGTVGSAALAQSFVPGSPGLGDPFFPNAGNGGYDVSHYSLSLGYEPSGNQLSGTAEITAAATQNLSRFDLDLRGFSISRW